MCKHVPNAQVSVRTTCCRKWYDCPLCHDEKEDHTLVRTTEMTFICKKCKKAFRKDMSDFDETDSYCPYCDNKYWIPNEIPMAEEDIQPNILNKIGHLDPRMIRDGDIDDEELGFDIDFSRKLG